MQRQQFEEHIKPYHADTMLYMDSSSSTYAEMAADPFAWADRYLHQHVVVPLLDSLSYEERTVVEAIPVGTLLTSNPNACAIQPEDSSCGAVIVVDWMLLLFIGQAIRPILRMLDNISKDEKVTMVHRVLDCMEYFTSGGHCGDSTIHKYDRSLSLMSQSLSQGAMTFVLGHEFSHILCGHLNPDDMSLCSMGFLKYNKNWEQEFEADRYGSELVTNVLKTTEGRICEKAISNLSCVSPLVLMSLIQMLEKFQGSENGSWSHPPSTQRRERLIPCVQSMLSEHSDGIGYWFNHVAEIEWNKVERNNGLQ